METAKLIEISLLELSIAQTRVRVSWKETFPLSTRRLGLIIDLLILCFLTFKFFMCTAYSTATCHVRRMLATLHIEVACVNSIISYPMEKRKVLCDDHIDDSKQLTIKWFRSQGEILSISFLEDFKSLLLSCFLHQRSWWQIQYPVRN